MFRLWSRIFRWNIEYSSCRNYNQYCSGNAQLSASATITGVGVMIVFGTDDTTACQAFLDAVVAVSAYGIADFQNLTYMVSALQVPSNIIITNANFIMLPGNTRLTSPLTIDGRTISPYFQTPKTNIIIRNVQINGLRHMQWGITTEAEGGEITVYAAGLLLRHYARPGMGTELRLLTGSH